MVICIYSCHHALRLSNSSAKIADTLASRLTHTSLRQLNNVISSHLTVTFLDQHSPEYFRMSTRGDESIQGETSKTAENASSSATTPSPSNTLGQIVSEIDDSLAANETQLDTDVEGETQIMTAASSSSEAYPLTTTGDQPVTGIGLSKDSPMKGLIRSLTNLATEVISATKDENDDDDVTALTSRKRENIIGRKLIGHRSIDIPGGKIKFGEETQAEPESNEDMMKEAWQKLENAIVHFNGQPVGTLAALDPNAEALNYNQVIVRDFVPTGLAYLMRKKPQPEIVKNFIHYILHIQGWEKRIDEFTLGEGVMPASFKVLKDHNGKTERLVADFGGSAIGRVAPVDSGFWWIILLRAYWKSTGDRAFVNLPDVQKGMKRILQHCLSDGFDTFPTLLCADGCSMIDRRMGVYGYPIEIQALFHIAMRCALEMILMQDDESKELIERINKRVAALSFHIQKYYWLDFTQLNSIYRYKTEEYSQTAVNKFNVIPDSIPDWLFDFMTKRGGYFIGNVSPARMDFRWFVAGNCIAILSSLATENKKSAIMDMIEAHWDDLIGEMPLKVAYPALEGHEWRIVTGSDPKNTRWSYHNGGSWPVLLWLFTAACIKVGRPQLAKSAIEKAEQRLARDGWPEYYDGKTGRFVGKQARKYQTWSIAGYLVAKLLIENPAHLSLISFEEDKHMENTGHNRRRSCSTF